MAASASSRHQCLLTPEVYGNVAATHIRVLLAMEAFYAVTTVLCEHLDDS